MTRDPRCCTPAATLPDVAKLMVDCDCGALPVVADLATRKPEGMITDRDIVVRAIAMGRDPMGLKVGDCMTSLPITIGEDAKLDDALELLEVSKIRRLIVVDASGAVCGIVAQADIALHASKREAGEMVREVSKRTEPAFAL
jgi:CBS domain-containing protein